MVLTLLTGLGIWATRSASLVDAASGNVRQSLQVQYIADLGIETTSALLATGVADSFVDRARVSGARCTQNGDLAAAFCHPFMLQEVEAALGNLTSGARVLSPGHATNAGESSLGPQLQGADLVGDFVVEMTDLGPAPPCRGCEQGGVNESITQATVVLTSIATVHPNIEATSEDVCNALASSVADRQMVRASTVIAPLIR